MKLHERFWSASVEGMKRGFVYEQTIDSYCCLLCGDTFINGEIFKHSFEDRFFDAKTYASLHMKEKHGSMLEILLQLDKKAVGLTELQKDLIRNFAMGMSDQDILQQEGGGSASTLRNHRFNLKEKAKQAKLLLVIMELMEQGMGQSKQMNEDRKSILQGSIELNPAEEKWFDEIRPYFPDGIDGPLSQLPSKEKRRYAVVRYIALRFDRDLIYGEKQVNELLKEVFRSDYVTLRRYLIDYGFLERKEDGSAYWVKDTGEDESEMEKEIMGETVQSQKGNKPDKETRKQLTSEFQEQKREMGVFQIKNESNGRIYIGGSTNLNVLWNKEKFILGIGTHMNKELQKEWKQFGEASFTFTILEKVKHEDELRYDYKDLQDADGKEQGYIAKQYKRQVDAMKDKWMEKLEPFGEKGYHKRN